MPPSLRQRLLAGGLWVLVGKALTAVSSLLLAKLLALLLTTEAFGRYATAFRLVAVGAMVALLGLQQAVVRLVAQAVGEGRPGRARAAVGRVYRTALVGIVVAVALLVSGAGSWLARAVFDSPALAGSMALIGAWTALQSLQILTSETFRGLQRLDLAATFGGVITGVLALTGLALLALLRGAATLNQVILLMLAAAGVSLALALAVLRRRLSVLHGAGDVASGEILSISLPLWIHGVAGLAMLQSDVLILAAFRDEREVAVYFGAAYLVAMVSQPLILVNLVVPPFIAELYFKGQRARLERVLRNAATLAGLPALGVLLAFLLFGAPILGLVYRDEYGAGATILALLSLGKLFNVLTGSCGVTLSMTGHQQALMRITLVTSLLTVTASLAVVGRWGGEGLALSVCAGTVLQNLWVWLATRRRTGMWTHVGRPRVGELRSLLGSLRG